MNRGSRRCRANTASKLAGYTGIAQGHFRPFPVQGFPSFTRFEPGGLISGGLDRFVISPRNAIAYVKDLNCTELRVAYRCAIQVVAGASSPSLQPVVCD